MGNPIGQLGNRVEPLGVPEPVFESFPMPEILGRNDVECSRVVFDWNDGQIDRDRPAARGVTGGFTAERLVLAERIPESFDHQRFVEDRDQLIDAFPVEVRERDADQVGKGLIGEANLISVHDEKGFGRMLGGQLGGDIRLGAHGLGFTIIIRIEVPSPVDQRLSLSLLFRPCPFSIPGTSGPAWSLGC